MTEFRMPSLGADMEEGTLIEWSVKIGDRVKRGDIIGIVRTEKADIEVEVYQDGVVEQLLAQAGATLPVGAVLAIIRDGEEAAPIPGKLPVKPPKAPVKEVPAPVIITPPIPPAPAEAGRVRASPLARRVARELGVDLGTLHGTSADGAISKEDVEKAAEALRKPTLPAPAAAEFRAGIRRAIAAAMARSNREIPHYYLKTRIDMDHALKYLGSENQKRSVKDRLLSSVLLVKAVARALNEVPELNGYWIDDGLKPQEAVHVGFAISLRQGGLVVPAIHHADLKTLDELMEAMRDLITRARGGRLRSSEVTDATITVTNLGDLGVETVYGVIYPPQVALVGFGRIAESPWAESGMLGIRPILTATLAGDHRATDGHRGAQFLTALNRCLQEPEKL